MEQSNRILVVVDPTAGEEQVVLKRAKTLALALDKDLELLICYYDQYLGTQRYMNNANLAGLRTQMISILRNKLDEFAKPLTEAGIDVEVSVIWDQPLDESIVRFAKVTSPYMVLKETHYHNVISRTLFTHTDWNLIRHCPFPLWLCKNKDWDPSGDIIASVDPMQEHEKPATLDGMILDRAEHLAKDFGSTAHVFHSYHLPVPTMADGVMMPTAYRGQELERQFERQHKKALHRLLEDRDIPEDRVHMESGATHLALPDFAESQNASLVVIGAVSRSNIKRVVLGSTAEKVLPLVPCDLLIIKPEWLPDEVEHIVPEIVDSSRDTKPEEVA